LKGARAPWWISGGWSLDLYLGHETREHGDLDVGCFRADLGELRAALDGWELWAASGGSLRSLGSDEAPGPEQHSLWCRPAGTPHWKLQLMLEERDGADWVFRRNRTLRLPAEELVLSTRDGTPFLRPEVQLLYKAKQPGQKDEADLLAVLPLLDRAAVAWLVGALGRVHPGHPWIEEVRRHGDRRAARRE
jgi:hypothetical protein